ncbi:unnamed protein product [Gadus morhua 'NCC']
MACSPIGRCWRTCEEQKENLEQPSDKPPLCGGVPTNQVSRQLLSSSALLDVAAREEAGDTPLVAEWTGRTLGRSSNVRSNPLAPVVRCPVTYHFPPACQQQPGCKVAAHAYPQGPGRRAFWGWGETGRQGFQHQRNQSPIPQSPPCSRSLRINYNPVPWDAEPEPVGRL